MASFISSRELAAARESKRMAREKRLEEEKSEYLRKESIMQKHKKSGNDKWMLPSIEKRIQAEKSKLSINSSDVPKHKKHKKKKKKKKRFSGSDESESEIWEEKAPQSGEKVQDEREEWRNFDFLTNDHTFTSNSLKEKKAKELSEKRNKEDSGSIGQHPRELNPYWKDGGVGLPSQNDSEVGGTTKPKKIHKEWLLRSLKRMKEQAEEQGRSIESIAAERYGSWEEFQNLLQEADPKEKQSEHRRYDHRKHRSDTSKKREFLRPGEEDVHSNRKIDCGRSYLKPDDDFDEPKRHSHHGTREKRPSGKSERGTQRPSWKKPPPKCEVEDKNFSGQSSENNPSTHVAKKESGAVQNVLKAEPTSTPVVEKRKEETQPVRILSEKEKNQLAAKILKAEFMGNEKLANSLKQKLERAREAEKDADVSTQTTNTVENSEVKKADSETSDEETVVLTRTGKDGQVWPIQHSDMAYESMPNKRRKKTKVPTHEKGERERYFADDDRHSLQDLVMREKTQEAEDQDAMMSRLASKQFMGTDSEYFTLDDMYVSEASRQASRTEEEARQKQKAIADHKKLARRMEKCRLCFGNPELCKHLLIAIGKKAYLMLPDHKPLTEGHCIIVPMHHCSTGTGLDEDVWEEVRKFMMSLIAMFSSREMDCVFLQTCITLKKSRHFYVDCLPMPKEIGDMAPIYFKKAIQECESEWTNNKKLIDTRNKDVRKCIPKGLPYFSADFGMDGGFAHVVEDESMFPFYFGREIVGGMLDVEPRLWRHPPKDHFTEQTKRSLQFSEWWKPHDWTAHVTSHS